MTGGAPNSRPDGEDSPNAVRPYVSWLRIRPDIGTYPREFRPTIVLRPRPPVDLVAWGVDTAHAALALTRGHAYAEDFDFRVRESFAGYGGKMSQAPLIPIALRHFERREVTYGLGWWLVPHSAIPPLDRENARIALRRAWTQIGAEGAEFPTPPNDPCGPQSLRPAITDRWITGRRG
ncbi:hypothetical protein LO772_21055 [Yinghuangia sp. ASG 101]|uniref:hypothetical protein n=1 Tax=Yinghuangia sp. ASG 101 TaxID=2896848 RepID=UPI001E47F983|nr:hypothetical protein [Yinghuangia sp. ASG 101]UGQ09424.1 hypothetical protein LO772_21055 [Yinghuangia sp. ASG 101]